MKAFALRNAAALVACVAVSLFGPVSISHADEVVAIPDPAFRDCLTSALGLPSGSSLTTGALGGLTRVQCGSPSGGDPAIESLAGAGYLTGIQSLGFTDHQIADLSPLAGLSTLRFLWITDSHVPDADPLASLTGLTDLYLAGNPIPDVTFVTKLTKLRNLDLARVPADVTPIAGVTTLTGVVLGANDTSDFSFLDNLPNLTNIEIQDDAITAVPSLGSAPNVTQLGVSGKAITDLSAVAGLANLQALHLWTPALATLDSLPELDHVVTLYAASCGLTEVDGLTRLPALTSLSLNGNRIADLSAVAGLSHLESLNLRDNKLTALPDLGVLDHLASIDVGNNELTSLNGLDAVTSLTSVIADNNHLGDIAALTRLTALTTVGLSMNEIVDISPLTTLPHLTWVGADRNRIADVSGFVAAGVQIRAAYQDVQPAPATVDTAEPLKLRGPDGSIPHVVPDAGVGIISGQITYYIPGTHHLSFDRTVGDSTFSGVMTQRAVPDGAFTVVTKPRIQGYPAVASAVWLSIDPWTPTAASLEYQWYRDGQAIPGATAASYRAVAADLGHRLKAKVTGARDGYITTSVWTSSTPKVVRGEFSTTRPRVVGTAKTGVTLSLTMEPWSPAPERIAYRWYRGRRAIKAATHATYTLTAADLGHRITVRVTGRAAGMVTISSDSRATAVVKQGPVHSATPLVTGTPAVGQQLGIQNGVWGPGKIAFRYQWLRDGVPVPKATGRTYLVTDADSGHQVSVSVTGDRSSYTAVTETSAPVLVT